MTETELEYQFCFNCNDRKNCYTKPKDCTRIKEEIGLQDMTNEEWFASLSTEEKAEWISKATIDAWFRQVNNELPKPNGAKEWAEWLKQPHTNE